MAELRTGTVVDQKMSMIDFRSDTVSWPTFEMRLAMANADVGDDVWGDDPTVIRLEEDAAAMLGKPAALFLSSGTQGNLLSLMCHCHQGDEVILGDKSHIVLYEAGGISAIAGCIPRTLPVQPDGTLALDDIKSAVRAVDVHFPTTRLIALENTQNKMGGVPLSIDYINSVCSFAHEKGLVVHMDGARLFNAATALGVPVSKIVENVDSVTFCLSKGLCAPVGSLLCGTKEFIEIARRKRKMLGGGMRQSGMLAAAGLIALHDMTKRLQEDHDVASALAAGLAKIPCVKVKANNTNFVFFELLPTCKLSTGDIVTAMKEKGILVHAVDPVTFRLVTHCWITQEAANKFIDAITELLTKD